MTAPTTHTFTDGILTSSELNTYVRDPLQFLLDMTWTDYSPSFQWTATSVNPAIGNGTIGAQYVRVGGLVFFRFSITMGTTTTYGTGAWIMSLPVAAFNLIAVAAIGNDFSASFRYPGAAYVTLDTATTLRPVLSGGVNGVSSTVPFTWAVSDVLTVGGVYRGQ